MSHDAIYLKKLGFNTRVDDGAEIVDGNVEGNVKGNDEARNVRLSLPGGKLHIRENMVMLLKKCIEWDNPLKLTKYMLRVGPARVWLATS